MPKVSFGGSPVIPPAGEIEKLYNIRLRHPILIRGLEISISVPKEDVKKTIQDLSDIIEELD